jgi:hypothetical protein
LWVHSSFFLVLIVSLSNRHQISSKIISDTWSNVQMPLSLPWREQCLSNAKINTGTFQSVDIRVFSCVSETNSYKPDFHKVLHVNWETCLYICNCREGLLSSD